MLTRYNLSKWQRKGLRTAGITVWVGLGALLLWGPVQMLNVLGYLLVTALLPFGWPQHFGRWLAVAGLLAVAVLPLALLRLPAPYAPSSVLDVAMLMQLSAWLMLPASLALLLWRRRAAAAVILLSMALLPVSVLLLVWIGPPPASLTESLPVHPVAGMAVLTPFWLVLISCSLGPFFFFAMFMWLLIREARGEHDARDVHV